MRCAAGVGLLALVGCNQLFSLGQTREFDAAIHVDVVPDLPHVQLTWQVAGALPSGAPDPTIAFAPIVPAPLVRIATLQDDFQEATYTDGVILIPRDYLGVTWRLQYTIVDGFSAPVPHEVQWAPEDKIGHLTVPMFGRIDRDPLPQQSNYKVKPTGLAGYSCPWLVTTGLWTRGQSTIDPADLTHTTASSVVRDATWLSGSIGRPDTARGDRAFLIDYITIGDVTVRGFDCQVAVGSVMLDSAEVQPDVASPQVPSQLWDDRRKPVTSTAIGLLLVGRLVNQLGSFHTGVTGSVLLGSSPSTSMPGLGGAPLAVTTSGCGPATPAFPPALPIPVMVPVLRCPYSVLPDAHHLGPPLPDTALPEALLSFPQILHVQLVDARSVLNVTLASGMEATIAADQKGEFTIEFPAPIPTRMALTTPTMGVVDLSNTGQEQVEIGPVRPVGTERIAFRLDFTPETPDSEMKLRADYHDVLLHRFEGGALTTDRIFTVTAPSVQIDGAFLQPGALYVLEIRTYKGHPDAARGDFATVDYPYGAAIVFTRTFKTS